MKKFFKRYRVKDKNDKPFEDRPEARNAIISARANPWPEVHLYYIGPKGGFHEGPTFYTRRQLREYIDMLEAAQRHAFPNPSRPPWPPVSRGTTFMGKVVR